MPLAADAGQLFRQHAAYVTRFLLRLGVSVSEVDDAVQTVFLVAHARGGYRPGVASPRTWLGAIALRVAANARRQRARRLSRVRDALDAEALPGNAPFADILLTARQELARACAEFDDMPVIYQDVLSRFLEGQACAVIAAEFAIPVGTVYSRLCKARRLLAREKGDV